MFEMNNGLFCGLSKHLLHPTESVTSCIIGQATLSSWVSIFSFVKGEGWKNGWPSSLLPTLKFCDSMKGYVTQALKSINDKMPFPVEFNND